MEDVSAQSAQLGIPRDEPARLAELRSYSILDTPRDGAFDDITRLASKFFDTPIAIVSLVDSDRVWFKSAHGLGNVRQIGRGPGLCASAIMQDGCYIARDLREDPNSLANPLVASENGFRFYAAVPLKTKKGNNLGTFCVLDFKPRPFSKADAADLKRFAGLVMAQMDNVLATREIASQANTIATQNVGLLHAANHDALTGLYNRTAVSTFFDEVQSDNDNGLQTSMLLLDIDHFKSINDTYGHHVGDLVLVDLAKRLQSSVRRSDHVVRFGGEEFLIILRRCPPKIAQDIAARIRKSVAQTPIIAGDVTLTISVSGGLCHSVQDGRVDDMVRSADAALYAAKNGGRDRIVVSDPVAA